MVGEIKIGRVEIEAVISTTTAGVVMVSATIVGTAVGVGLVRRVVMGSAARQQGGSRELEIVVWGACGEREHVVGAGALDPSRCEPGQNTKKRRRRMLWLLLRTS